MGRDLNMIDTKPLFTGSSYFTELKKRSLTYKSNFMMVGVSKARTNMQTTGLDIDTAKQKSDMAKIDYNSHSKITGKGQ